MTYPPQPPQQPGQPGPYGQQPDPYGQQPGQYGPPPTGPEGTAQFSQPQFGGEPPYGGGQPPYADGEPPKSRKGPIIGVVAAVVVILAAVGITGFWQPGFFLADEKDDGGGNPQTSAPQTPGSTPGLPPTDASTPGVPTPPTTGEGPATKTGPPPTGADAVEIDEVAADAVRSINERDAELAKSVSCEPDSAGDLSELPEDAHAEISGEAYLEDPDKAKVPVRFSVSGQTVDEELQIERHDGRWCVSDG